MKVLSTRPYRFALLLSLYLVQGLPYGFQVKVLPLFMAQRGTSNTAIGFIGALALPWLFKALWAPLVDRYGSARFGRRKSWILPLQLLLVGAALAGAEAAERGALVPLLGVILVMNLIAATQDIAVDGLAVDILGREELGAGNTAQVAGYKVGMLLSGGALLALQDHIGWSGIFVGMALITASSALLLVPFPEPPPAGAPPPVLRSLKDALMVPGTGWLLALVGTYKLGETMMDVMLKPFLLKVGGYAPAQLGLWLGTYAMLFSIAGSAAGGLLATTRLQLLRSVELTAVLRVFPLLGVLALSLAPLSDGRVIATLCAEHFFAGALTTAMFAYMMSRVDRRIGATHYTLLATVEVLGKSPGGWTSGIIADRFGFPAVFATAAALSVAYLVLFPLMRLRSSPGWRGPAPTAAGASPEPDSPTPASR
ncbi:MAG TPA: MFS transporter [Myxococcales bacterium]|jgi:MFS family permease|nr:MFS transporter [Myxococcales bacterium]